MDAVTFLTKEHQDAKALFEQIQASSDPATKERLTAKVITALRAHTKIEEEILYTIVREQLKGGSKMFEEAMQEHQEAKEAMKELESMSAADEGWTWPGHRHSFMALDIARAPPLAAPTSRFSGRRLPGSDAGRVAREPEAVCPWPRVQGNPSV